jgi:sulfatase maturation enzyme AslB (radical SAM superfamily)
MKKEKMYKLSCGSVNIDCEYCPYQDKNCSKSRSLKELNEILSDFIEKRLPKFVPVEKNIDMFEKIVEFIKNLLRIY